MIDRLKVKKEEFISATYGKSPLYVAEAFPSPPLGLSSVEDALMRGALQPPAIRMAKGGRPIPLERYTSTQQVGHFPTRFVADERKIAALILAGASLVVDSMERWFPEVRDLCAQTSTWAGEPVDANLYITPKAATGFSPHWDAQEVFMIQLWGSKSWSVWSPEQSAVIGGGFPREELGIPLLNVDLSAGDILYVPRGFVHSGSATGNGSAHLSISVNPTSHAQTISELISRLASQRPDIFGRVKKPSDDGAQIQLIELTECLEALCTYVESKEWMQSQPDSPRVHLAEALSGLH